MVPSERVRLSLLAVINQAWKAAWLQHVASFPRQVSGAFNPILLKGEGRVTSRLQPWTGHGPSAGADEMEGAAPLPFSS